MIRSRTNTHIPAQQRIGAAALASRRTPRRRCVVAAQTSIAISHARTSVRVTLRPLARNAR